MISIEKEEDIVRYSQIAMLLEVSGYPKPGNVHRTWDFPNTRFEHFLIGAIVCGKTIRDLVKRSGKIVKGQLDYSELKIGDFILEGIKETLQWQKGGNINLGMLLLLYPISAAAGIVLKQGNFQLSALREEISKIVKKTTTDDAVKLYTAIDLCQPGGLGEVKELDVTNKSSIEEIIKKNISLYEIFELCASWDNIAAEWTSKFKITFEIGTPYFQKIFQECNDINIAIVDTFLYILSRIPDTLIQRKSGIEDAKKVSEMAFKIINTGGLRKKKREILELDKILKKESGKLNPGTTADLTAATIMINLLIGLKI
ncbi:MAG: triphosphoribosyl-dephospho-CoA synthase [Candidatus Helarchaeota archaeon]